MELNKRPFIGQMDLKIGLYLKSEKRNQIGESLKSLDLIASPYARLEYTGSGELFEGKPLYKSERQYTFRYLPNVAKHRGLLVVKDQDQEFEVLHLQVIGRRAYITIKCVTYE